MISLNVEYMPDKKIALSADKFRNTYHLTEIPIDIEYIVEFNLEMDIIYQPGLRKAAETDGFITSDFSAIYIDADVYDHYPYRFRFTLAHEVGHYVLHQSYFAQLTITSLEDWFTFFRELDQRDYGKLEYQGYTFGGYLLVPPTILKDQFLDGLERADPLIKQAKEAGLKKQHYIPYVIDFMAEKLSPIFKVSTQCMIKRIEKDLLYKFIT